MRTGCLAGCVLAVLVAVTMPVRAEFTPLGHGSDNSENRTGLWFCPKLGGAADILPLATRIYATRESVTGGVALRVDAAAGSRGRSRWSIPLCLPTPRG